MKKILLQIFIIIGILACPNINFAQTPDLGTASGFALFTADGAFTSTGATNVTGDIGTNVGVFSGFPPGTVSGAIHVADPTSVQAALDVNTAYTYLKGLTCGAVLTTTLGNNQILTPNVYCLGAASTLNGSLTLDGQGDPNALFIFQIDGAFTTSTLTNVSVINSAAISNVYWQINGEFILGDNSVFRGNVVNNGAITLLNGASLLGRGLSRAGAIAIHNNMVIPDLFPAPIKMTNFKATNAGYRNVIEWTTETETGGDVFGVERSTDGINFVSLSTMNAAGKPIVYSYYDESPFSGLNYYRLKMTTDAGNITYSPIVTASMKASLLSYVKVYPNPVHNNLTLLVKGTPGKNQVVTISDMTGRKLKQISFAGNSVHIKMNEVKSGMYTLTYFDDTIKKTIKINKQ
ncbi:ice-binding family protein [Ferruginibacter lapsinanis]|uniref:ice-binding family protein n=1 Tax=Ferruginibacter lapsinanis TaxID=563172 RepID=UPI001E321144|nr:ice-binding family protein [Ferruginibacter lapsinanis]UEG49293.1 ice-binding family protein [Ferruginibacter lapsinanis]